MVVFFVFFVGYRTVSPGVVIFPIVFLLTLASAIGQKPVTLTSPLLRSGWVFVHVVLIFTGYAGLFLSFGASLLYIVQERSLKSKRSSAAADLVAAAANHRRDLLQLAALRLPVHDAGPRSGIGAGHR